MDLMSGSENHWPGMKALDILYEDTQLLVCEKPAGLPVQSARIGTQDLVSILKTYRMKREGDAYIGLVHRLDQPVAGVMVFAKTRAAAASLSAQAADGRMCKKYIAIACGKPMETEGRLVDHLLRDGRTNTSSVVPKETKGAKRSELAYRVLDEREGLTLLEITLLTGRHHQIRVQLSHAGLPLAGDRKYNFGPGAERFPSVALAACQLSFLHPATGKRMEYFCECPSWLSVFDTRV